MTIGTAVDRFKNTAPARQRVFNANAVAVAASAPLTETEIAGSLSLIDRRPLTIAAERGLVVRVRSGSLRVAQRVGGEAGVVGAGERFIAECSAALFVAALETTELRIEWPLRAVERLSPGLELIEADA